MDNLSLNDTLAKLVQQAQEYSIQSPGITLTEAVRSPSSHIIHPELHNLSRDLLEPMQQDLRLSKLTSEYFNHPSGRGSVNSKHFASNLLKYAIQEGCEAAINWLESTLALEHGSGTIVLSIWGPQVQDNIDLTPEITLCAFAKLPDSDQKARLNEMKMNSSLMPAFDCTPPTCALLHKHKVSPLFYNAATPRPATSYNKVQENLGKVARLISVIGPQISIPGFSWFTFDNPELERFKISDRRMGTMLEVLPIDIPEVTPIDPARIQELAKAYLSLDTFVAERIDIALERLSLALRRQEAAEKAVELSIAMESLLINNDRDGNGIASTVKNRATRFLGGDASTRKQNSKIVDKTYSIRSTLVHTGKKETENQKICGVSMTPIQIIKECERLCADIIVKIIKLGKFPEWHEFDIIDYPE